MKNRCACRHPILLVLCCPQSAPFQPSAVSEYFIAFGEARWRRRHAPRVRTSSSAARCHNNGGGERQPPSHTVFRPPARLSTPVVTLRIGCSATPDAPLPLVAYHLTHSASAIVLTMGSVASLALLQPAVVKLESPSITTCFATSRAQAAPGLPWKATVVCGK